MKKIVEHFVPQGGKHCITNSLKQIFYYYGIEMSEEMLEHNNPILLYVDMPYLKYLGLNENSHFGGHAVVLFGYDEEKEEYLISDRDNHDFPIRTPSGHIAEDFHYVSFDELKQARTSTHRPFPAKNKYLEIDLHGYQFPNKKVIARAIEETCVNMLSPPANLLGLNGISKF